MVANEETVAVIQERGGCGLDMSGGVEVGSGSGSEVYSILEEESFQPC